jgi:hypothetical protein
VSKLSNDELDQILARLDDVLKQAQELQTELRERMARRAEDDYRTAEEIRSRRARSRRE